MQIAYIINNGIDSSAAHVTAELEMINAAARQNRGDTLYFYYPGKRRAMFKLEPNVKEIPYLSALFRSRNQSDMLSKLYRFFIFRPLVSLYFLVIPFIDIRIRNSLLLIRGDRALLGIFLASRILKIRYLFEIHNFDFSTNPLNSLITRLEGTSAIAVITISEATKLQLMKSGIPEKKIMVMPSGVNYTEMVNAKRDRVYLNSRFGIPEKVKVALYIGKFGANRGLEDIFFAASKLPEIQFLLIGGNTTDLLLYKTLLNKTYRGIDNVILHEFVGREEVYKTISSVDVLLAPYSAKISTAEHMSPIKVIEYMASGIPMVVPNLPRIKEIIDADAAVFYETDDRVDFVAKIHETIHNYAPALQKAQRAREIAGNYSWDKRVQKILLKINY